MADDLTLFYHIDRGGFNAVRLVSWWAEHPVLVQHCFTKDRALQLDSCNEWNWSLLCWVLYALCCLSETLSICSASQIIFRKLSFLLHVIGVVISNHLPSKHNSVRKFKELRGYELDVHGSVHHNTNLIEMTNKMQPCSTIYYSIVPWLINMFWAILLPSSGASKL